MFYEGEETSVSLAVKIKDRIPRASSLRLGLTAWVEEDD